MNLPAANDICVSRERSDVAEKVRRAVAEAVR
jgi:hypothetical protein